VQRSAHPFRVRVGPLALLKGKRFKLPFQRSWKALIIVLILAATSEQPGRTKLTAAVEGDSLGYVDFWGLRALISSQEQGL